MAGLSLHHGMWGGMEHNTLFLCYLVEDVDEAVTRVRAAGGEAHAPTDEPYGRVAECVDDQGTAFAVFSPPGDGPGPRLAPHGSRPGDLAYVTLEVADTSRTPRLLRHGTGLAFLARTRRRTAGRSTTCVPGRASAAGTTGPRRSPCTWSTTSSPRVRRVRAAGGTATDPETQPYGVTSDCVDDQGTRFFLGEL